MTGDKSIDAEDAEEGQERTQRIAKRNDMVST